MIYQLHEFQKTVMAPAVAWADTARHLFTNPLSPLAYTPLSRTIAANSEMFVRLMRRYPKPAWGIDEALVNGERVAITREVVIDKPFCQLLHFRKAVDVEQPKLLIVAPLSGHFATLLRDTVRTALADHDVWITDWVDAKMVPLAQGAFHLDDYVDYIREFIRFLSPELNVMSVCQPTVPVLAAVSLMAAESDPAVPKAMIMMGGRDCDLDCSCGHPPKLLNHRTLDTRPQHLLDRLPRPFLTRQLSKRCSHGDERPSHILEIDGNLGVRGCAAAEPQSGAVNSGPQPHRDHRGRRAHRLSDAGESILRPLLRHPARRSRLCRSARCETAVRTICVAST
jgi:polyhydroxyalkanoate depolymerase